MTNLLRNLVMTSQPAEEPVTLDAAKNHLRLDSDITQDDAFIGALITAAREKCESLTKRAFITRSYQLRLDGFPGMVPAATAYGYSLERLPAQTWGEIKLPKPPLVSVDSVQYVDPNGVTQTLDPALYQVDAGGVNQGVIRPAYGLLFPQFRYQLDAVTIDFTAGFSDPTAIPSSVGIAMLLLINHWYRNRSAVSDMAKLEVPMGVKALLSSVKWGFYG